MNYFAIARPYAIAAFDFATEHKLQTAWLEALCAMKALLQEPQVQALILHPEIDRHQLQALLCELLEKDLDVAQKNFLKLLVERKRLACIAEIVELFQEKMAEADQVLEAKLTTVFPVDEPVLADIKQALESRFKQKIELEADIDKALLGGAIIRSKDWVIDGSVRGQLEQMAKALIVKG